jgi:homoserine dehydrogenase
LKKIALLGHGVVGSGVMEILTKNQKLLARQAGEPVEAAWVLDRRAFPGLPYSQRFTQDFSLIREDPEVAVVLEALGGVEPAFTWVREALLAGKSVVTSNKELVAEKGAELLALAQEKGVHFLFEASVGGGIPILQPLRESLTANHITEIAGILNGTTNYILTKMFQEGRPLGTPSGRPRSWGTPRPTPPPTWRATTPAGRFAFWPPSPLGATSIPRRCPPRASPASPRRM